MNYITFIEYLKSLSYSYMDYTACDHRFCSWRFNMDVDISYVISPEGIVRQQYDNKPNIVKLHFYERGYSGYWKNYTFEECMNLIISKKIGSDDGLVKVKKELRKLKLEKLNESR